MKGAHAKPGIMQVSEHSAPRTLLGSIAGARGPSPQTGRGAPAEPSDVYAIAQGAGAVPVEPSTLVQVLAEAHVLESQLLAAAELLQAMASSPVHGGGLSALPGADDAIANYLHHVEERGPTDLEHFLATRALRDHLEQDAPAGAPGPASGRSHSALVARTILAWSEWRDIALDARDSADPWQREQGEAAVRMLAVDVWEQYFRQAAREGTGSEAWFELLERTDDQRLDSVLELASRVLPLDDIAVGPTANLDVVAAVAEHVALDMLLGRLAKSPGRGLDFIAAALESPVTRHRYAAVRTLSVWGAAQWPAEARALLKRAARTELTAHLRETIRVLLG